MNTQSVHTTVLLKESVEGLNIVKGDTVADLTLGAGGHSSLICKNKGIKLYSFDADPDAILRSKEKLQNCASPVEFIRGNFADAKKNLEERGVMQIDKALFDLGLSSDQLESSGRGFSFNRSEPLLMTLDPDAKLTAYDVVNTWSEENLKTIIKGFGEEKMPGRIARMIVERRKIKQIETSKELAEIVVSALPSWKGHGRIHPATKTFQAIRMAVNNETENLKKALNDIWEILNSKGRIAVISFHSIEDRIVKNFIRDKAKLGEGKIITKKPITPSEEEIINNPRSRSAKLRIIEKI